MVSRRLRLVHWQWTHMDLFSAVRRCPPFSIFHVAAPPEPCPNSFWHVKYSDGILRHVIKYFLLMQKMHSEQTYHNFCFEFNISNFEPFHISHTRFDFLTEWIFTFEMFRNLFQILKFYVQTFPIWWKCVLGRQLLAWWSTFWWQINMHPVYISLLKWIVEKNAPFSSSWFHQRPPYNSEKKLFEWIFEPWFADCKVVWRYLSTARTISLFNQLEVSSSRARVFTVHLAITASFSPCPSCGNIFLTANADRRPWDSHWLNK